MTDAKYPYLNLREWPYQIVASPATADVWVGRADAHKKARALLRSASRVPSSQIALLWASFGSGKTHALLHLQSLAEQQADLTPLYVVTPKGIRSFLEIYRAIADAVLSSGTAMAAGTWLFEHRGTAHESDVDRALMRLAVYGDEDSSIAGSWLRADKIPMKDLRQIGIAARIESTADAIVALNRLVHVLTQGGNKKVLLLLDEVQELEELGKRLSECVGGLHKVFDQNAEGLTMVLSFTTGTQAALRGILGETLFDRASLTISLPPLSEDEAITFIKELTAAWSIDPSRAPFPFTSEAIGSVIAEVSSRGVSLTPRTAIKAFNQILREAEADIEDGTIDVIDEGLALESLPNDVS